MGITTALQGSATSAFVGAATTALPDGVQLSAATSSTAHALVEDVVGLDDRRYGRVRDHPYCDRGKQLNQIVYE